MSDEKVARSSVERDDAQKAVAVEYIDDPDAGLSEEERAAIDQALVRKLDMRIIPWLTLLYLAAFLDRTNVGNAKIEGLAEDLHLTGGQYNASLSVFFVSYAVFEPLSNVLLKRMKPHIYLPTIMILWGISMTFMGFCFNYGGLVTARWFLGVFEAGLFPGVNYYFSCWYKRREFGIRASIFFSAAAVSGSFGGLLAAAISQMDGIGGKAGWAWIFILEGLATVLLGLVSYWVIVDFPDDATFLSPADKLRVQRRLLEDKQSSAEHEEFKMKYFWQSVTDWKTYLSAVVYMGADGPLYAYSLFLPTIIKGLDSTFSATKTQLLTVPPYAVAGVFTVFIGYISDRTGRRGLCNIISALIGCVGFSILLGSTNAALSYFGTFLAAMGIYPCIPNTVVWVGNNVEGVYKRGVTLGFVIGWGNLNGVMSSNVYRNQDAPRYFLGHSVLLAYMAIFLLLGAALQMVLLNAENHKRRAGKRDHRSEGLSDKQIDHDLGDQRPDFFYTL